MRRPVGKSHRLHCAHIKSNPAGQRQHLATVMHIHSPATSPVPAASSQRLPSKVDHLIPKNFRARPHNGDKLILQPAQPQYMTNKAKANCCKAKAAALSDEITNAESVKISTSLTGVQFQLSPASHLLAAFSAGSIEHMYMTLNATRPTVDQAR